MNLKTLMATAALCLLALPALCTPVIIPASTCVDDNGLKVTPTSVTIASVTDLDGNAIASPGATAHFAGPNISVVYDAGTKGQGWITLVPVLAGHTFANYQPVFASDTDSNITAINTLATTGAGFKIASGQSTTASNFVAAPTPAQNAAAITFPATVSLSSADEAAIGKLTFDASSYLYANAKVLPATTPTGYGGGSGGGSDPLATPLTTYTTPGTAGYALTKIGTPAGTTLAADIAGIKSDTAALASHQKGRYTYNPATHLVQLLLDDGVTPFGSPMTLVIDSAGNTTSR